MFIAGKKNNKNLKNAIHSLIDSGFIYGHDCILNVSTNGEVNLFSASYSSQALDKLHLGGKRAKVRLCEVMQSISLAASRRVASERKVLIMQSGIRQSVGGSRAEIPHC